MSAGARPVVLVIDDDDTYRSVLVMLLEDQGYDAVEASTLAEARTVLAERRRFDVVLLDASLPDGRGLTLVPELRKAQPTAKLVLLSGTGNLENQGDDGELAARILKGGAPEELVALLHRLLPG